MQRGRVSQPTCGLAEREGFEPSRPLRAYGISSAAPSTELGDRSVIILPNTAYRRPSVTAQRMSNLAPVDFAPVRDSGEQDKPLRIVDRIDDAKFFDPNSKVTL